jgi:hypothetical protein
VAIIPKPTLPVDSSSAICIITHWYILNFFAYHVYENKTIWEVLYFLKDSP